MVDKIKVKRILVVDDQEIARRAISVIMEPHGHVDHAETGHQAISKFAEAHADGWEYDLICMDITMPGLLNGHQAVRGIRAHEENLKVTKPVPVVMISAFNDVKTFATEMNMSGVDDYISKPFNQSRLDEVVQRFLQ